MAGNRGCHAYRGNYQRFLREGVKREISGMLLRSSTELEKRVAEPEAVVGRFEASKKTLEEKLERVRKIVEKLLKGLS